MDNILVYATGGLAVTEADLRFSNYTDGSQTEFSFQGSDSETLLGWTVGAGAEIMLGETVSLKAEYLYADFDTFDFDLGESLSGELDITSHIARGGVNFHF